LKLDYYLKRYFYYLYMEPSYTKPTIISADRRNAISILEKLNETYVDPFFKKMRLEQIPPEIEGT